MVTVYLCPAGECATEELITQLAKPYFSGNVPEIFRQDRGKPYFAGDTGVHFSVSHSGSFVALAFAETPVGIDLQQHKHRNYETREDAILRHKKLASRYFHPQEQALLESDPWEGFFRIWTAKESFVKRTGRGIDHGLSQLCILPQGNAWEDKNGFFRQKVLPGGYTLTLSTESPTDWTIHTTKKRG
jgi:phosphopantetheinyl transferase